MLRLIRDFFFPSAYDLSKRRAPRADAPPSSVEPAPAPEAGPDLRVVGADRR